MLVRSLCGDSSITELVIPSFKDIQKGYRVGGYYYERKDSRKNSDVINHFYHFCFSDKNRFHRIPSSPENEALIKSIGEELKKKYIN